MYGIYSPTFGRFLMGKCIEQIYNRPMDASWLWVRNMKKPSFKGSELLLRNAGSFQVTWEFSLRKGEVFFCPNGIIYFTNQPIDFV